MRGIGQHPSGLRLEAELVAGDEEIALLSRFADLDLAPVVMHGVESRRRIAHFGAGYDFDRWLATDAEPLPSFLLPLRDRCARLGDVDPASLEEVLVTYYPSGASIGWHRDAAAFGAVVVGVSLASAAVMRFQRRATGGDRLVFELSLPRRSAYVLSGSARTAWQHSIRPVDRPRWSVTFRQLRSAARRRPRP